LLNLARGTTQTEEKVKSKHGDQAPTPRTHNQLNQSNRGKYKCNKKEKPKILRRPIVTRLKNSHPRSTSQGKTETKHASQDCKNSIKQGILKWPKYTE